MRFELTQEALERHSGLQDSEAEEGSQDHDNSHQDVWMEADDTGEKILERPTQGPLRNESSHTEQEMMSDIVSTREKTIDEMKIKTMFRMIEDVSTEIDGVELEKKVLYLTNKQCSMFDEEGMKRCIEALDLGEPKCIIRLIGSYGTAQDYRVHIQRRDGPEGNYEGRTFAFGSELGADDSYATQKQLVLFFKNCLLPLAKKTRALILLNSADDCALTGALERVVLPELERLGSNCPFTILGWGNAYKYLYKSVKQEGLSGSLSQGSNAWSSRLDPLTSLFSSQDASELEHCDLTKAATHYIIFEGVDFYGKSAQESKNDGPNGRFKNLFLQVITSFLPSIAIATTGDIKYNYDKIASLTRRSIPTLLLDSRQRAFTSHPTDEKASTRLSRLANQYPSISMAELDDFEVLPDGSLTLSSRLKMLDIAKEMLESQEQCFKENKITNCHVISDLAFLHTVITSCARSQGKANKTDPLWRRIEEMNFYQQSSQDTVSRIPLEVLIAATDFAKTRMTALGALNHLHYAEHWLETHEPKHEYLVPGCKKYIENLKKSVQVIEEDGGRDLHMKKGARAEWSAIFDILQSPSTFSASIHDIDKINAIFSSVARIDRLPESNSLEALIMLQDAWDHFDIYTLLADRYKFITKSSYMLLLLNGIAITFLSIGECAIGDHVTEEDLRNAILGLSLFASAVTCFVGFVNPAQRWMQLRGAALSLESHIWKFRTRSCEYRLGGTNDFDASADDLLSENIHDIKANVLDGADIKGTTFFGRRESPNHHGQHKPGSLAFGLTEDSVDSNFYHLIRYIWPAPPATTIDATHFTEKSSLRCKFKNAEIKSVPIQSIMSLTSESSGNTLDHTNDMHFMPVQPDDYCKHRIQVAINMYKRRIPYRYRMRYASQAIIVSGGLAGVLLASFYLTIWAAVVSISTGAVTAWMEFTDTSNKSSRYSVTTDGLQRVLIWWNTRQPIEKSSTANIDKLVSSVEELLQSEQSTWRSSSQAAKLLAKENEEPKEMAQAI